MVSELDVSAAIRKMKGSKAMGSLAVAPIVTTITESLPTSL